MIDNTSTGDDAGNTDPFNLTALREPQGLVQVRKRRLSVPVRRKPNRLDFVRTHPDPEYRVKSTTTPVSPTQIAHRDWTAGLRWQS